MTAKKRAKNVTPRTAWLLTEKTAPPVVALGVMLVVILLTLAFNVYFVSDGQISNRNATASPAVKITTTDGVTLTAETAYPAGAGPFPVVIFVHEFGQDRHQWDVYHDQFIDDGFAMLAYDT